MSNEIQEKVISIIASQTSSKKEDILLNSTLEDDIGVDSLDKVELVMAFEEEFNITISDDKVEKVKIVNDIIEVVVQECANSAQNKNHLNEK